MTREIHGNIFDSKSDCLVNTVNCVGAMGKGIALEMSLRFPEMEKEYKEKCARHEIEIGKLWLYKEPESGQKILNFPTKFNFRYPSKMSYIEDGLRYFSEHYHEYDIESIAFPLLGAANGKLEKGQVLDVMHRYLDPIDDLEIEIYLNDAPKSAQTRDKFFEAFIDTLQKQPTPKNNVIVYVVENNRKIVGFADLVEAKISQEQPNGLYKRVSVATKKYVQSTVRNMRSAKNKKMQPQRLFD